MEQILRPTKEQVREWLKERQIKRVPPPEIEQIQCIVGWKPQARTEDQRSAGA